MLYTGDPEQLPASPRHSTDKVEPVFEDDMTLAKPVLDGDVPSMDFLDLPDFPDDVDLETEHVDLETEELSEADMDSMLETLATACPRMSCSAACRYRLRVQRHQLMTPSFATPPASRVTRAVATMTNRSPSWAC